MKNKRNLLGNLNVDKLKMVEYHLPSDREIIGFSLDGEVVCRRSKKIAPECLRGKKAAVTVLNHLNKRFSSGLSKKAQKKGIYFCFPDKKCVWVINEETALRGFGALNFVQVGWKIEKFPLKKGLFFFICVYEFSEKGRLLVPHRGEKEKRKKIN